MKTKYNSSNILYIEIFCHLKQVHNDIILERSNIIHDLVSNEPADCNYGIKIITEVQETNELEINNESFEGSEARAKRRHTNHA